MIEIRVDIVVDAGSEEDAIERIETALEQYNLATNSVLEEWNFVDSWEVEEKDGFQIRDEW